MAGKEVSQGKSGMILGADVVPVQKVVQVLRQDQLLVYRKALTAHPPVEAKLREKTDEFARKYKGQVMTIIFGAGSGNGKAYLMGAALGAILPEAEVQVDEQEDDAIVVEVDGDKMLRYVSTKIAVKEGQDRDIVPTKVGQPPLPEVKDAIRNTTADIAYENAMLPEMYPDKIHIRIAELVPVVTENLIRFLATSKNTFAFFLIPNQEILQDAYTHRSNKLRKTGDVVYDMSSEEAVETMGYDITMEVIAAAENAVLGRDYMDNKYQLEGYDTETVSWITKYNNMTDEERKEFFKNLTVFDRQAGTVTMHPMRPLFQKPYYAYKAKEWGLTTGPDDPDPNYMIVDLNYVEGEKHAQPARLQEFSMYGNRMRVIDLKEGKDTIIENTLDKKLGNPEQIITLESRTQSHGRSGEVS